MVRAVQSTELTLDRTLAKIHKQFALRAWRGWSKVFALHEKLRDCIETGQESQRFHRAHELLHAGLSEWLNDLARETQSCFRTLVQVGIAQPDWVPDDPVRWARAQIDELLTKELEQGAKLEEKQWVGPAPLVNPAELESKPARHLDWFRRACDGPPNITLTPESPRWREPWCAPVWVSQNNRLIAGWMRLTVEQTNSIIWLAQSDFKRQLKVMLDDAEETAYISLARQPRDPSQQTSVKAKSPEIDSQLVPDLKDAASRRAAIDEYIAEVLATKGARITRRDIWKKAGYASATEFQRWQRDDQRQSKAAGANFRRILTQRPHLS